MKLWSLPDYVDSLETKIYGSNRIVVTAARAREITWVVIRMVLLIGLSFIMLYPLLYMLSMAFRPLSQVMDPTVIWIPRTFTIRNLEHVIATMRYGNALWVTVYICILSALISVITCCLTGYGFARFNFPFKRVLFIILLFTIIVPPQTLLIPLYIMNAYFDYMWAGSMMIRLYNFLTGSGVSETVNLLGTPYTFYLPALFASGIRSGLLIYIYRQFFTNMPKELEEAAYIDGAGPLRAFMTVMLPNARPVMITVLLFSIVWYWNDFFFSGLMLSSTETPISIRLTQLGTSLIAAGGEAPNPIAFTVYMQAGSFLTILPPLILYLVFQRYFTESIERSGLVG